MYIYTYVNIYISYIYIYYDIYGTCAFVTPVIVLQIYVFTYMYIYIYKYVYICTHIRILLYIEYLHIRDSSDSTANIYVYTLPHEFCGQTRF